LGFQRTHVPMVKAPSHTTRFNAGSFDKAFHSPEIQNELKSIIDPVVLPNKGKLTKTDQECEYAPEFIPAKRQHSAVESAINSLEAHELECPDHHIDTFEHYDASVLLSYNIQILSAHNAT